MKKLSKLLSLALAILMVMSLAGAAFAVSPDAAKNTTITITGAPVNAEFKYYRLMDLTRSGNNYSYTIPNATYLAAMEQVLGVTGEAKVLEEIGKKTDPTVMRTFANDLYEKIKDLNGDGTATAGASGAAFTDKFGYYLIAQTTLGGATGDDSPHAYSLVMINTGDDATKEIAAKIDVPTSIKKLQEKNDTRVYTSLWQDGADYDIGDSIDFLLRGDVSSNLNAYEGKYTMIFHDDACDGLTFDGVTAVKVLHNEAHSSTEQTVTTGYQVLTGDATGDNCTFHVVIDDVKKLTDASGAITMHGGEEIQVFYKMTLNAEHAVVGTTGNPNESWMTFSNNPYVESSTDDTPHDKVKVFTYQLKVVKQDGNEDALPGATFQLYKVILKNPDVTSGVDSYTLSPVGGVNEGENDANGVKCVFNWIGLDAGTYVLKEEKVPDGYTKAKDIYFTINAKYEEDNSADPQFTAGSLSATMRNEALNVDTKATQSFSYDETNGVLSTTVVNMSGALLPSTGGIGTTMFYVFGSILAIGAGVLLVSKKRMGAAD